MRKLILLLALIFISVAVQAQPGPQTQLARKQYSGTAVRDLVYNYSNAGPDSRSAYLAPKPANLLWRSEAMSGSYHEPCEYQCRDCNKPFTLKSKPHRIKHLANGPQCASCRAKETWQRRGVHKPTEYTCRNCLKPMLLKGYPAILKLENGQPQCRSCSRKKWFQTHEAHNKGVPMSEASKEKLRQAVNATWTQERRKTHSLTCLGRPSTQKGKKSIHAGPAHYNWKGGITPANQAMRASGEYQSWRLAVFQRDRFRCVRCGNKPRKIEADHIQQWAIYTALRFDVSNGQTLCVPCHRAKTAQERSEARRAA